MAVKIKGKKRKSKDEMQQEFEDLISVAQDESDSFDAKSKEIQKNENIEIVKSIENINPSDIIKKFADLNIEISDILSSLSDILLKSYSSAAKIVLTV